MGKTTLQLDEQQENAVATCFENGKGAIFGETGTGKTIVALETFKRLKATDAGCDGMLVVAPVGVILRDFPKEVRKHFSQFSTVVLHPDADGRDKVWESPEQLEAFDIWLINVAGLPWLEEFTSKAFMPEMLVVDECDDLKNMSTRKKGYRAIRRMLPDFSYRYAMTGTPLDFNEDLFGQIYLVDEGERLGKRLTHARERYMLPPQQWEFKWKMREGAEDEMWDAISDIVVIMRKDEGDLPEISERNVEVTLEPKLRRHYNKLRDEFISTYDGVSVTADSKGVLYGKLRQITGGALFLTEMKIEYDMAYPWQELGSEKLDALDELYDLDNPALVGIQYQHEAQRISERFNVPALYGGTPVKQRDAIIEQWLAGELPFLPVHPRTGGRGLNLQSGPGGRVIYYTLPWEHRWYNQLIGRLWRKGRKDPVEVIHLMVPDSVDYDVLESVHEKRKRHSTLFERVRG